MQGRGLAYAAGDTGVGTLLAEEFCNGGALVNRLDGLYILSLDTGLVPSAGPNVLLLSFMVVTNYLF